MTSRFALALTLSLLTLGTARAAHAQACTTSATCGGRTCVDGQCCNTACGGGDPNDCQACSTAAGAPVNGTCATLPAGRTCRASIGVCDVTDVCSGLTTACPDDVVPAFPRTLCRGLAGPCDVEEFCTGSSPMCPPDAYQPMGYLCRYVGPCDLPENCPGDSVLCPLPDLAQPEGIACLPTAPEPCSTAYQCMGGMCRPALGCVDTDICTTDSCVAGACVFTPMVGCDGGVIGPRDAGPRVDAGVTPPRDAGPAGMDAGSGGACGGPICPCPRPSDACDLASDCGPSEVCVEGVCGEHTCVAGGSECMTAGDCPAGSACTAGTCVHPGACATMADCAPGLRCEPGPTGESECVGAECPGGTGCPSSTVCVAEICVEPRECVDERDCPLGFGCEPAGSVSICVDRRPPCSRDDECPFGFVCDVPGSTGGGFCRRVVVRCDSAVSCQAGETCVDVDGDGEAECQATGDCSTNADCDTGEVCGISPLTGQTECGPFGPCDPAAVGACPDGYDCVALDPGGVAECVLPGGSCADDSDCAQGQVCATTVPGEGPACFEGTDPALGRMDGGVRFDAGPDVARVTGGGCLCGVGRPTTTGAGLLAALAALAAALVARARRV